MGHPMWLVFMFCVVLHVTRVKSFLNERQMQELLLLDLLGKTAGVSSATKQSDLIAALQQMIPGTCKVQNQEFECGLSINCARRGGVPMNPCGAGGSIWVCCVIEDNSPRFQWDDGYDYEY